MLSQEFIESYILKKQEEDEKSMREINPFFIESHRRQLMSNHRDRLEGLAAFNIRSVKFNKDLYDIHGCNHCICINFSQTVGCPTCNLWPIGHFTCDKCHFPCKTTASIYMNRHHQHEGACNYECFIKDFSN